MALHVYIPRKTGNKMASVASHTTWGRWRNADCTPGSTLTCQNLNTTKLGLGDQFTCFTSNNSEILPLSVSVMQDLAWARRFCAKNPKITLFFANQECPRPQDWDFSWRTRKFRSEVATNTPPLSVMQDLPWVRGFCAPSPKNTLFSGFGGKKILLNWLIFK